MKKYSRIHNKTIESYVEKLHKHIIYIHAMHNKKVILICHSMGGLIACKYIVSENKKYIHSVICISSPLQGAPLLENRLFKVLFNTNRHIQMTPNSMFLELLYQHIENTELHILTVGSNQDIHVPDKHAKLPIDIVISIKNYDHININGYGHFSIVSVEYLWQIINYWINKKLKR